MSAADSGTGQSRGRSQEELLAHLPGTLHRREWRDFGQNRTELMEAAGIAPGTEVPVFPGSVRDEGNWSASASYLQPLIGTWTGQWKMWMAPGAEPMVSEGTVTRETDGDRLNRLAALKRKVERG